MLNKIKKTDGGSFGRPVFGQGIGMYGDEQISFGVIGNFSAPVQGDEYVPVPRIRCV